MWLKFFVNSRENFEKFEENYENGWKFKEILKNLGNFEKFKEIFGNSNFI